MPRVQIYAGGQSVQLANDDIEINPCISAFNTKEA